MILQTQKISAGETSDCREAARYLRRYWPRVAKAGIILGTGLGHCVEGIECDLAIPYSDIPHFPRTTALSHHGRLVCGAIGSVPVVALEGRFHFYEGYSADEITLPISVMRRLGVDLLIVSNASGGLNPQYCGGDIMVLSDHINLMGRRTANLSQLRGTPSRSGDRLPYDPQLIDLAQSIARRRGIVLHRGTYVAVLGPNYETRAEYRAMRRLGGDAVGMSTIPEVLAAANQGMKVLGLSTITNIAKPDCPTITEPQQVVELAASAEPKLRRIITEVLAEYFADERT